MTGIQIRKPSIPPDAETRALAEKAQARRRALVARDRDIVHRATLERLVAEGVTSRSPHFKRLYNTYTLQEARVLEDRRKAILAEREAQKAAAAKKAKPAAKKQKPAVSKPKAKPTTKKPPKAASSGAPGIGRPSASDPDSVTKWIESGRPVSVRRDRLAYARRHGLKHRIPE